MARNAAKGLDASVDRPVGVDVTRELGSKESPRNRVELLGYKFNPLGRHNDWSLRPSIASPSSFASRPRVARDQSHLRPRGLGGVIDSQPLVAGTLVPRWRPIGPRSRLRGSGRWCGSVTSNAMVSDATTDVPGRPGTALWHACTRVPKASADDSVSTTLDRMRGTRFDSAAAIAVLAGVRLA